MTPPLKVITVRQPWAIAIAHFGKTTENRGAYALRWTYRGPLLIHAAKTYAVNSLAGDGLLDPRLSFGNMRATAEHRPNLDSDEAGLGVLLCRAELAGIHRAEVHRSTVGTSSCCQPWGEATYASCGGQVNDVAHLELVDVEPLDELIPIRRGRLGLWNLTASDIDEDEPIALELEAELRRTLGVAA